MEGQRKVLGVIGGMGTVATAHFFSRLTALTPATRDQDYLEVILHNNSLVPDRTDALLGRGPDARPQLIRSCRLLDAAGADVIAVACITSHAFLNAMRDAARVHVIDAIAATADHCVRHWPSCRRAGILATSGALQSGVFQRAFAVVGMEVVSFPPGDQEYFFTEPVYGAWGVKAGHVTGPARDRLVAAGRELAARGADLVIAGCTEVPVVVRAEDLPVPLVDVTDVLVRASLVRCGVEPV